MAEFLTYGEPRFAVDPFLLNGEIAGGRTTPHRRLPAGQLRIAALGVLVA